MEKQQKQLIMTGVLVVILIFSVMNSLKKKPGKKKVVVQQPPVENNVKTPLVSNQVTTEEDNLSKLQEERIRLAWGRDPFSASVAKDYQISEFRLQGISFGKNKTGFAFINDEIVKKDDRIGDYEVVEVEKDKVLLRKGNQTFYITFPVE